MQIQFNSMLYNLVNMPNIQTTHFQATIYKDNYSLNDILEDIQDTEQIKVFHNEETVSIYNGYKNLVAMSIYYKDQETLIVSIELLNTDVQNQIEQINGQLNSIENDISILTESQETQDLAIEDLAEAVSDLTPEE